MNSGYFVKCPEQDAGEGAIEINSSVNYYVITYSVGAK